MEAPTRLQRLARIIKMPLQPRRLKIDEEFPGSVWELRISKSKFQAAAPSVLKALEIILQENDIISRLGDRFNARLINSKGDEYTFKSADALEKLGLKQP